MGFHATAGLSGLPGDTERSSLRAILFSAKTSLEVDPGCAACWLDRALEIVSRNESASEQLVIDQFAGGSPMTSSASGGLAPWQIRRIVGHVDAHMTEDLSVASLARICGLSAGHLSRAFKTSFGETPHSYVVRQRVRRAQIAMLERPASLAQIALAVGLADQAHLNRLFRKLVGPTPMAWRRANRQP